MFAFTTPPTPNAGIIRPILANADTPQSRTIREYLSPKPKRPCLLYRSKPSKWNGVETNCIAAGAKNWAVFVLPDSVDKMREKRDFTTGGRFAS